MIVKVKSYRVLLIYLRVLRVFGGFPYRCRYVPGEAMEVARSRAALLWSVVAATLLSLTSVTCIAFAPNQDQGMTREVSTYILNYVTYSLLAVFFPYLALSSSRLATIVRGLAEARLDLERSCLNREDSLHAVCLCGVLAGVAYVSYCSVKGILLLASMSLNVTYYITSTLCDVVFEVAAITAGLLVYHVLKLLSLECEEAVARLQRASSAASAGGRAPKAWATSKVVRKRFSSCKLMNS